LARENARLKKDVQKWAQLHTEETVRYDVLEVSWMRRRAYTVQNWLTISCGWKSDSEDNALYN